MEVVSQSYGDGAVPDLHTTLSVNLGAVIENSRHIRRLAPHSECAAMVKADAYGLGLKEISQALYKDGIRTFFVASLTEAVSLRSIVALDADVYVLNGYFSGQAAQYLKYQLRPVLNSLPQIECWLGDITGDSGALAALHIDTGMNRLGLSGVETDRLLADKNLMNTIRLSLLMSHLACADQPEHPYNKSQLEKFKAISTAFPGIPKSLANSAGVLLGEEYHFDMVRPGLALYGGAPCPPISPFENVFTAQGKVLQLREVDAGSSVGYGATHTFRDPARIATVNVGYADGYLQCFNGCGQVYFKGQQLSVLGKVSMDLLAVDVTAVPDRDINVGDDIELFGPHETLLAASRRGHISQYEILTLLGKRYKRSYKS
tara:strand:+ start:931 stop:2052 length:1122 start_codon:yes stop_codon:yes gene_type:complete